MASIPLVYGVYKRDVGRFPELALVNCYAEKAPSQMEKQVALIARPAVEDWATAPDSNLRGIFRKAGIFDGDMIVVCGTTVVRIDDNGQQTTLTGSVAGSNRVRIDGGLDGDGNSLARIATGSALYQTDGATVTAEDFPTVGGAGAQDICYHRQHWLAIEAGTDKVYLQLPGDTAWNQLTYAAASYSADSAIALRSLGDQIWILGAASTEVWALTGDAGDPITPYDGLKFDFGCVSRDCAVVLPDALLWVDNNSTVRLTTGGAPEIISDNGLAEEIRGVPDDEVRAWGFTVDQHPCYCVTFSTVSTKVFDLSTRLWSQWKTEGEDTFLPHMGCDLSGVAIGISSDPGSDQIYRLNPDLNTDDAGEIIIEFTAMIENPEGYANCPRLELIGSVGFVPLSGDSSTPIAKVRYSDNQAKSWSNWKFASMPTTGNYGGRVRWGPFAQFKPPYGRIFHLSISANVVKRVTDVRVPNAA